MRPEPLEPVRAALLAQARADAERISTAARAAASEVRSRGEADAAEVLAGARAAGRRAGELQRAAEDARARRRAHGMVLAARRAALDELKDRSRAGACALAAAPDYQALVALLSERARAVLGRGAVVTVEGPEGPGGVARSGRRRVDLRLAVLADEAVEALGSGVERLWG